MTKQFLPVNLKEAKERGIDRVDFVYVCGDAYVDHPSFGMAIITRMLEARGFTIGIIAQPDFTKEESFTVFGEPRLGFLVSAGNMDSMVNHYSVSKRRRDQDMYSPGGKSGFRPDHAVVVYGNQIRKTYKKTPIIIGGIEASLRRMGHYDYWSDKVKRSILLDSGADLISYGMGEHSIAEIADALNSGIDIKDITFVRGTVFKTRDEAFLKENNAVRLPDFEEIKESKITYAKSFYEQYKNTDPYSAKIIYETYDKKLFVVQNPPAFPLTRIELDDVYSYNYMKTYHPMYEKDGGIPAIKEVKFSLVNNRGCFGGCNFCALTFHQGRIIQSRSISSIVEEAKELTKDKDFKGYIHDVGGPTANFRRPSCDKQMKAGVCSEKQCLFPTPCKNLKVDHTEYIKLLRELRAIPKVKKVFIRSGIRFDYVLEDKNEDFLKELCEHHVSGQLKVAPEHISRNVLKYMGKPDPEVYKLFVKKYQNMNKRLGKDQYLIPYLMSSHPGATIKDAIELALYLKEINYTPEQVQDFYPTPSTLSTCMYYTGIDPRDMKEVYVARNPHEKAMQRALMQFKDPRNYELVKEALIKAGREDLIGFGEGCLIPPRKINSSKKAQSNPKEDKGKVKGNNNSKNYKSSSKTPQKGKLKKDFHSNGKSKNGKKR